MMFGWSRSFRANQELPGQKDVKTTMIYRTSSTASGTLGVRSPADVLWRPSFAGLPDTRRRALQSNTPTLAIPPSHQLEPGEIVTQAPEDFDDDL
jgi:hypothetical protein